LFGLYAFLCGKISISETSVWTNLSLNSAMIKIYKRLVRDKKFSVSHDLSSLKGTLVYSIDPSKEEAESLSVSLGLSSNLIKDALDPYEVPRLEESNGLIFAISSFPIQEKFKLTGIPFGLIVGDDFVSVISSKKMTFLEDWFENGGDFVTTQKTKLVNLIFKKMMEEYSRQLTVINKEYHRISMTPEKISSDEIKRLVWFEESLNLIAGDLEPTDAILRKILSGKMMKLFDEDKELIEDTILYTEQLIAMVKSNLMKITNLRNVYSAIMTDNLNNTMKLLAGVTVILTIPTIIASIYGMNVNLPLQDHPMAFMFVVLFILLATIVLVYLFVKNKWF